MSWSDSISPAQANLITKLGGTHSPSMTRREASDLITQLQANANANRPQADPAVTAGVYKLADGTVYVVKPNKDKSRLYAKRLVETGGTRITESGERVPEIDFEYESGAIFKIKADDRMPVDEAKRLTALYGRCIVCGRHLKAAESVERGIGPVCIKSFKHAAADPVVETADGRTGHLSEFEAVSAAKIAGRQALAAGPIEHPIDAEARWAREQIVQALGCLRLEADYPVEDAERVLAIFNRLVNGFER